MKIVKKIIAVILVLTMCFSFAGCYNEDLSWAAKDGDEEAAIGIYLYYLYFAYDKAQALVDSDTEVLKATIEGKPAEEWIRDTAMDYLKSYFWVNAKIKELGLDLTENEIVACRAQTTQMVSYYMAGLDEYGISEASINKAYTEYNVMFRKLFDYYYGEGGEKEISKEVLHDNFVEGCYAFEFIYAPLTKQDDLNQTVDITEEEKEELYSTLEGFKKKIETGYENITYAGQELQVVTQAAEVPYKIDAKADFITTQYPAEVVEAVKTMDEKTLQIVEANGQLLLIQKDSIDESFEAAYSVASQRLNMMLDEKSDEFSEFVLETAKAEKTDLKLNQKAIDAQKISSLVTDKNKYGAVVPVKGE